VVIDSPRGHFFPSCLRFCSFDLPVTKSRAAKRLVGNARAAQLGGGATDETGPTPRLLWDEGPFFPGAGDYGECAEGCKLGPRCGDGKLQADHGEACDDGNSKNGDGCSTSCKNTVVK
jgi:cysteine-rich repeat protein